MADRPDTTARRTVRVRIAVAVDHSGDWAAGGMAKYVSDDERNRDLAFIDDLQEGEQWHWIEADVPVPERDHSAVIEGLVTNG